MNGMSLWCLSGLFFDKTRNDATVGIAFGNFNRLRRSFDAEDNQTIVLRLLRRVYHTFARDSGFIRPQVCAGDST